MGIEIQPDGTPIKIPDSPNPTHSGVKMPESEKTPTSDFVAQVQSHIDETKEKPDDKPVTETQPIVSGPGNPAPQHAHLIDGARKFNENLKRPPATFGVPYPIQMNIGIEAQILAVLRDNGMDTQQQEKAMGRIAEILSTAKQSLSQ
jgi:hypothetical protein